MADGIVCDEWREVPGWPEYRINRQGCVQSRNKRGWAIPCDWHDMRPWPTKSGYMVVDFWRESQRCKMRVHRLVLETFVGPSNGLDACHNNGDKTDNRLENLRWDTRRENIMDSIRHGTHVFKRMCTRKLTDDQVRMVRELADSGKSHRAIGQVFGVSNVAIWKIVRRKTFVDVA